MCKRMGSTITFACFMTLILAISARADVRLPHIFSNEMVLQRDIAIPVWGWADPGELVTVKLDAHNASATADANGKWMVKLPSLSAGGPYEMTVTGKNTLKLSNILIGEVWVCSGQSNMEMGVGASKDAKAEIAAADYPQIRLFLIPRTVAGYAQDDVTATWRTCTPANIAAGGWNGFSAAAYYFGREIHKNLNVPVGLIDTAWGGTRIEPWTPVGGFHSVPALENILDKINNNNRDFRNQSSAKLSRIETLPPVARKAFAEGKPVPGFADLRHPLAVNNQPTALYNAMINPLVPFAIRGAIWYQGEANLVDGMLYFEKMKALIGGWRQVWGQGDFPFYYVQIAPFDYGNSYELPVLWKAQCAALSIPNTGMVVTTDIAIRNNIHPTDKQAVGKRLALWALAKDYGQKNLVYSGPLYKSYKVEGAHIRVIFDYAETGLASRDGKDLTWFEIAGADGEFVPAQAKIDGNTVIVSSPSVTAPTQVRLGWHGLANPNLMNKENLPASPFTTAR